MLVSVSAHKILFILLHSANLYIFAVMEKKIYVGTQINDTLHASLSERAKKNGRSISSEMRVILDRALCSGRTSKRR